MSHSSRTSPLPASFPWRTVVALFLLGLGLRGVIFLDAHDEGDELIYIALVEQLENGKGYSLVGHPLLESRWIDRHRYRSPLFFHPPGGIALFWIGDRILGKVGLALVPLFSYGLFFWSAMLAATTLSSSVSKAGITLLASLTALNPVVTHVCQYYWLDGPLVGFSMLATALFLLAVTRSSLTWAVLAGIALGYASLIKLTAFLVVPGLILLGWAVIDPSKRTCLLRIVAAMLLPAFLIQLPWELWQTAVMGTPFPGWAGKPSTYLLATNPYVNAVTHGRTPWFYWLWFPAVLGTFLPSVLLLFYRWEDASLRRRGLALVAWTLVILGFHSLLGALGYSKLIRYVVLAIPATSLLAYVVLEATLQQLQSAGKERTTGLVVLSILLAVGFLLEMAWGIKVTLSLGSHAIVSAF